MNKLNTDKTLTLGLNKCIKAKTNEIDIAADNSPNLSIKVWNIIPLNNNSSARARKRKLAAKNKTPENCKLSDNSTFTPIIMKKIAQNNNVVKVIIITEFKLILVILSQKKPRYTIFELDLKYSMIAEGMKTTKTRKTSFTKAISSESHPSINDKIY